MAGAGAKLFTSGSVLTADQVNTFLMDQSIMRFASTTARDDAFGGAGEPTLAEGMFAYTTDTNTLWLYDGAAWVAAINASSLNGVGSVTPFTPTWNVNLTVGNGTQSFNYVRVNNLVFISGKFTLGSTSAVLGNISFSTPITSTNQAGITAVGDAFLVDTGGGNLLGFVAYLSNEFFIQTYVVSATYPQPVGFAATTPFTWSTGDSFSVNIVYMV